MLPDGFFNGLSVELHARVNLELTIPAIKFRED